MTGAPLGGNAFSAHPRQDPATGNLLTYSYQLMPSLLTDKPLCVNPSPLALSACASPVSFLAASSGRSVNSLGGEHGSRNRVLEQAWFSSPERA
jgi:hypothetical protein